MTAAPLAPQSAVYIGWLRHRRKAPVVHAFTYPLFMVMLDLDRIPELMRVSPLTSHNRWNWASFHDRDHFGDPARPLRQRLVEDAMTHGIALPEGPRFVLTHLRYAGYGFNPVSFYYCFDRAGSLCHVMAEVNNTFGGSRNYWLAPDRGGVATAGGEGPAVFTASASKALYVSPFMDTALDYGFSFTPPGATLVAHMTVADRVGAASLFDATLSLERRPCSAGAIRSALWRYPLMTAKVTAAIHFEALRLWRKGVPVVPRSHPRGLLESTSATWPSATVEP